MSLYRQKLNTRTGAFNLVPSGTVITFKEGVANAAALPLIGNTQNDARITYDAQHLYVWSGTAWVDQGDILDLTWAAIENKPSSLVEDIDEAVSLRHVQDTDEILIVHSTNFLSQYPPEFTPTYVKATTFLNNSYSPSSTTNPLSSLTGPYVDNQWLSVESENNYQRFHIDLGSSKIINRIYYENTHNAGGLTGYGAKHFTFWGSNSLSDFENLIYTNDGTWVQLTVDKSIFDIHVADNIADPKYIMVNNSVTFRYYAFKFADNWSGVHVGVRRIELQTEEGHKDLIDDGVLKEDLLVDPGKKIGTNTIEDITDAVNKKHTRNVDEYLVTPVTNTLYVDGNRADTYTANGSITKPFKKIQDAIDTVTSPSATNKYLIEITPGAYYTDTLAINKVYITFRSCGVQGARISGAITVTNPGSPTPEQITFVGLRISGGLTCLASHVAINCIDCNVTGTAWTINPTTPTDDEYLQVWGGLWYVNATLTNVYSYLMGGGYYSTFVATNCEFNINNADINDPFQVTLNGTVIASAYGDRAGNSKFIVNAGATLNIDADTEGGSVLILDPAAILNRTTKASNIKNIPAGTISATDVQTALNELDIEKPTISSGAGVPGTTPTKVGDVYIDTNNKKLYFATGISSSADWTIAN